MQAQCPFPIQAHEASRAIYVTNIASGITSDTLSSYFIFSGTVLRTAIAQDVYSECGFQCALLVFKEAEAVEKCLLLNGSPLNDVPINIFKYVDVFTLPTEYETNISYPHDALPSAPPAVVTPTTTSVTGFLGKALFATKAAVKVAHQKTNELDEKLGVSRSVKGFDQKHGISDAAKDVGSKVSTVASSINNQYQITSKVSSVFNTIKTKTLEIEPINKVCTTTKTAVTEFTTSVSQAAHEEELRHSGYTNLETQVQDYNNSGDNSSATYPTI
ncbi:hypothetical protein RCL1_004724 [Eukaryota sp. TZLM3-RCL]